MTQSGQPSPKRTTPRLKVFQPAVLTAGMQQRRVHLLDLSQTGCKVHGDPLVGIGAPIRLDCGVSLGAGRIVWIEGQRFGVVFLRPLATAIVATILNGPPVSPATSDRPA